MLPEARLQALNQAPVCGMVLDNCRVLRLDLLHAPAGGNKYFKLKHHLATLSGEQCVVSFGGAWSNHIHALAALGSERGFATLGIIRGERAARLSATLRDALDWGMQLHFVSRAEYRRRTDIDYLNSVHARFGPCVIVPEGGASAAGVAGCREIVPLLAGTALDWDVIALACATGSTLAGIACELTGARQALGVSVLKGQGSMRRDVARWISAQGVPLRDNWRIEQDFHAGGYARTTPELRRFMLEFERVQGIALDQVYTGKLFHALYKMRSAGALPRSARVIAVHTGGLQGRRGADY